MEPVKDLEEQTTEGEEEHIHLPPPSWAPIILALGMAGVAFGFVLGGVVLGFGAVLLVIGLGTWVMDEVRNASATGEADADTSAAPGGHTHPAS